MFLNNYRDEVKEFLIKMGSNNGDNVQKVNWLNEEFDLLKEAVNQCEEDKIRHQLYDMLYLILEIAADNDFVLKG